MYKASLSYTRATLELTRNEHDNNSAKLFYALESVLLVQGITKIELVLNFSTQFEIV